MCTVIERDFSGGSTAEPQLVVEQSSAHGSQLEKTGTYGSAGRCVPVDGRVVRRLRCEPDFQERNRRSTSEARGARVAWAVPIVRIFEREPEHFDQTAGNLQAAWEVLLVACTAGQSAR